MSDLVSYLLDRFRTDADVLRRRAAALRAGPKQPGPDAATSQRMADACADVVAMLEAIPAHGDRAQVVATLTALVPLLERRAAAVLGVPPLRAVYAGAAVRVREVVQVDQAHADAHGDVSAHAAEVLEAPRGNDSVDEEAFGDDELDDDELDDDELDDDELDDDELDDDRLREDELDDDSRDDVPADER